MARQRSYTASNHNRDWQANGAGFLTFVVLWIAIYLGIIAALTAGGGGYAVRESAAAE